MQGYIFSYIFKISTKSCFYWIELIPVCHGVFSNIIFMGRLDHTSARDEPMRRSSRPQAFCKKVFLKISQNPQENVSVGVTLKKFEASAEILIRRLRHRCFPVNFVIFLIESFWWLPLMPASKNMKPCVNVKELKNFRIRYRPWSSFLIMLSKLWKSIVLAILCKI